MCTVYYHGHIHTTNNNRQQVLILHVLSTLRHTLRKLLKRTSTLRHNLRKLLKRTLIRINSTDDKLPEPTSAVIF